MEDARDHGKLNPSQQRRLLSSFRYADKLLAEIEAVLAAAQSKSPFPKFQPDISPAQVRVVQDYISRMRAQIVRILEGLGVPVPAPSIGSVHAIRVTLGFVDIAFDECRPQRMTGYGDLAATASTALSGLVDEMQGIISRLDSYLAQGQSADLAARLQRLGEAGGDLVLVQMLERAIGRHGLVELRPAIATIIDCLETDNFEIAVFGRVSSGKSSLLNHIVGQEVLPVGVNPITAVPTRLVYGPSSQATAWFADRTPEHFGLDRLSEYVTEQHNPANREHVTRIVVELPAARLREGVVYVDTPGLGSLATSGAAETRAYLPRCDLGVVLIDAGSTLTQDDLATVQTLLDAGIPASVLLSKADLLAPDDRERARQYVAGHLRSDLGLELPVSAVSIKNGYTNLLDGWLDTEILPLYDRHAELARQSVNRKIGALRLGVEAALKARLKRGDHGERAATEFDTAKLREMETGLRAAAGKIAESRTQSINMTDALRECGEPVIRAAAAGVVDAWTAGTNGSHGMLIRTRLEQMAGQESARIAALIQETARHSGRVLAQVAAGIKLANRPAEDELLDLVKNMPRFDLGSLEIDVASSKLASMLGRQWAVRRIERQVNSQAGQAIAEAVTIYARVAQAWVRRTFAELQERFDSYADAYRAQLDRLLADQDATVYDEQALQDDLAALAAAAARTALPNAVPNS